MQKLHISQKYLQKIKKIASILFTYAKITCTRQIKFSVNIRRKLTKL